MFPRRPTGGRLLAIVAALFVVLGITTIAAQSPAETTQSADETTIHLRIWQRIADPEELWVSARPAGGRWDEFGTVRLGEGVVVGPPRSPLVEYPIIIQTEHVRVDYGAPGIPAGTHRISGIGISDLATLRIWQRVIEPQLIWIQAPEHPSHKRPGWAAWRTLGLVPLPLDDGYSPRGFYRYGNLTIVVAANPGLRADRAQLLALRDVLTGSGAELDWSVDSSAKEWEGITLGGTPPRVVGLDLSNHGLSGEIWGWLGELEELTELRLDGNALRGMIPSKLALLNKLEALRLEGNDFTGCVPTALREIDDHDLNALDLPDCDSPKKLRWLGRTGWSNLPPGTYWLESHTYGFPHYVVFDVPTGRSVSISASNLSPDTLAETNQEDIHTLWDDRFGIALHDADNNNIWVYFEDQYAVEWERSHYAGRLDSRPEDRSATEFIECLIASAWGFNERTWERNTWP